MAPTTTGRHAPTSIFTSYLEEWAQRYPKAQQKVERVRLANGDAKHRAHRKVLPARPPKVQVAA